MEIVATSAEMRACDSFAIKHLHIPGIVLMEHAGRGTVESMCTYFGSLKNKSVLIVCGKGNNGGDGFVVARHLLNLDVNVTTVLVGENSSLRKEAKANYIILKSLVKEFGARGHLRVIVTTSMGKLHTIPPHDIIVDALFGTGFSGEVGGLYKNVIEWMNRSQAKKVSIDVPSGLNADDGSIGNCCVRADLTVTMGVRKVGLIVGQGRSYAGIIDVLDIGIPSIALSRIYPAAMIVHETDITLVLPKRPSNAHKHSVGKILVIAGSRGLTGAAALTAQSAMRSGAGAVVLGTPSSVFPILAKKLTEVMVEPLPETQNGTISMGAFDALAERIAWADILVVGPGLSREQESSNLILKIIREVNKPMLLDADALNALRQKIAILMRRKSRDIIITPHAGEFAKLIGATSAVVERQRISLARDVAKKFKLTLVLKGAPTVVADESGEVYINSTGNPGMATAGSGDVLAGCIGALWGQGMSRTPASYGGVFIHGLAGDIARATFGEKSLMATDIQQHIPNAFCTIERLAIS